MPDHATRFSLEGKRALVTDASRGIGERDRFHRHRSQCGHRVHSHQLVPLEKVVALPSQPTMGARLDLCSQGVETPLEVIGGTLRPEADGPPEADHFLAYEALAAAQLARFGRRADVRV